MAHMTRKFVGITTAHALCALLALAPAPALPEDAQPNAPQMMNHGSTMPMQDHAMPGHNQMLPEVMQHHQQMMAHMHGQMTGGGMLNMPGQDAFGAIAEVVRVLEADPKTDWSKVDLEALRQHLIDMNDVTLNAVAVAKPVDSGVEITATGTGRTIGAISACCRCTRRKSTG